MKKHFLFFIFVIITCFITHTANAQTFYTGKYRTMFETMPGMKCVGNHCRIEVAVDSFVYAIHGFKTGDEFEVTGYCNRKLIFLQQFYMNGDQKEDEVSVGNFFKDSLTLDVFLKTIFDYSIPK